MGEELALAAPLLDGEELRLLDEESHEHVYYQQHPMSINKAVYTTTLVAFYE